MDKIKERSLNVVKISIALTGFVSTFFTIMELTLFFSHPNYGSLSNKEESNDPWTWSLIMNTLLLSIFILQHSLFALEIVKDFFTDYGMKDIQRSIYIIFTCLALQLLVKNWHYTNDFMLWQFSVENQSTYGLYILVHTLSWLIIYIGSICMDINELLGLKQVYYSLMKLPEPLNYKTKELRNLYSHMRHPSFVGFIVIFWFIPVMRLDRLLLATFLTLYMFVTWKTDDMDYSYQKVQISRKFQ